MFRLCFTITVTVLILTDQGSSNISPSRAKDLLEILKKVVNESVKEATTYLDTIVNGVEELVNSIEDEAQTVMQGIKVKYKSQLDILKQRADDVGTNIDDCLGDYEEYLINLPNQFFQNLAQNFSSSIKEGILYAVITLDNIKQVKNQVAGIQQELEVCEESVSPLNCSNEVADRIQEEIVSVPNGISEDVDNAEVEAEIIIIDMEDIVSDSVDELNANGNWLLEFIIECVESKVVK